MDLPTHHMQAILKVITATETASSTSSDENGGKLDRRRLLWA
jgi:hypothetical protein